MSCEEVRPRLAAYAVDALDPSVKKDVEAHLAQCARCSDALDTLRAVEKLAIGAPLRPETPGDLEERVFAYVDAYEAAQTAAGAALGPEPPSDLERRSLERAGVLGPPRPLRQRVATILAPAFAAAAALLSFLYMDARNDLSATAQPSVSPTSSALLSESSGTVPRGHPMQTIQLWGSAAAADLQLVHFRHDNYRLELRAGDLPSMPPTHYYEVWLSGDNGKVSAGSFRLTRPDDIVFNFNVGIDPAEYHLVEVTREPVNGSAAKEGPVVMRGVLDPDNVEHD